MPMILGSIDQLRGRFVRLKGTRGTVPIAAEMGLHVNTLRAFLLGGNVTVATLQTIEDWCDLWDGDREGWKGSPQRSA